MADEASITTVTKKGEGYRVEGGIGGTKVSVDIPAAYIEKRDRKGAEDYLRRSLKAVAEGMRGR